MSTDLTRRQEELRVAVTSRSSDIGEQLLMIHSMALRVAASQADVTAVRAVLLAGHEREASRRDRASR